MNALPRRSDTPPASATRAVSCTVGVIVLSTFFLMNEAFAVITSLKYFYKMYTARSQQGETIRALPIAHALLHAVVAAPCSRKD